MKKVLNTLNKAYEYFKKHSDLIGYILLGLLFIYIHIEIWINLEASIQADMSSELVLSKILSEQKRIMTTDWFYSTELKVLHNTLVFTPLFWITDNWHIIRIVSIIVLNIICSWAFIILLGNWKSKTFLGSR